MSTKDLQLLVASFINGLRDAVLGFVHFYRLNQEDVAISNSELTKKKAVTELQRRREERLPKRASFKSEKPKIRKRILQCCLLNGGVCLASLVVFNNLVLPVLEGVTHLMLGHEEGMRLTVWSWLSFLASGLFKMLWILPLFILSRIVSFIWFQDIADAAYSRSYQKPAVLRMSVGTLIADLLFSLLIQSLFLCQAQLAAVLPIPTLAQALSVFHISLLNAFYAFEYKWFNLGWEINKRLRYIEVRWSYFCGFGLPLALVTQFTDSFWINGCVFSLLFPLLIVSANEASPIVHTAPFHLPIFSLVVGLSNYLFHRGVVQTQQKQFLSKSSSSEVASGE